MNIKNMIPFLDDEELNMLADKIISGGTGEYKGIKMSDIMPFLDEDKVDELFMNALELGISSEAYAPFVSDDVWEKVIKLYPEKKFDIRKFYPFMNEEDVGELLKKVSSKEAGYEDLSESDILSFADDEYIDEAFFNSAKCGGDYKKYLPYVSEECLSRLADEYVKGNADIDIDEIYPYMDDDDIKKIFRAYINRN